MQTKIKKTSFRFNNGIFNPSTLDEAIFICYSNSCKESGQYKKMEAALPYVKGLKRKINRMKFAYELVNNFNDKD